MTHSIARALLATVSHRVLSQTIEMLTNEATPNIRPPTEGSAVLRLTVINPRGPGSSSVEDSIGDLGEDIDWIGRHAAANINMLNRHRKEGGGTISIFASDPKCDACMVFPYPGADKAELFISIAGPSRLVSEAIIYVLGEHFNLTPPPCDNSWIPRARELLKEGW
jgi:hypothetical protein